MMKTLKAKWTGFRPLVMHNGQLADPTNEHSMAMKNITSKGSKKMTDADYERLAREAWIGGLYYDQEMGPYIPSDNIERCIQLGAQKSRVGKDVQAAVLCSAERFKLEYDGPRDIEKLEKDPRFQLRKGVVVNKSRVMRVRPMFPTGWSVVFELDFDESVVSETSVVKAMLDAGAYVGIGDWRPKFGRFTVEVL